MPLQLDEYGNANNTSIAWIFELILALPTGAKMVKNGTRAHTSNTM